MSVENSLPLPVVQMGHVEKLAEVAQNHPVVQQQVAQETAKQELLKANSQVAETTKTEKSRFQRARERDARRGQGRPMGKKQRAADNESGEEPESSPHDANPWAGNILNMKV